MAVTPPRPAPGDPFGTTALRSIVLAAWAASPARFREDANAEEALTIGYADRVIAELAANAADAAQAAGEPGRLWIRVQDGKLRAANTGAPLTAAGVAALASLRASAKRASAQPASAKRTPVDRAPTSRKRADGKRADREPVDREPSPGGAAPGDIDAEPGEGSAPIGHFGVGFTAVRAVTDEPLIVSTTGGVRFSVADTLAALAELRVADLDAEVRARAGQIPALRLPWPVPSSTPPPPTGFATEVRLPLRPDVDAAALAGSFTAQACLDLMWALPGLVAVRLGDHEAIRAGSVVAPEPMASPEMAPHEMDSQEPALEEAALGELDEVVAPSLLPPVTVQVDGRPHRFRVATAAGRIPAELLADRPVEERARDSWRLSWVLPLDEDDHPDPPALTMVGAPTPTDEPLTLPALLVGTLPVDDTRRHLAGGPLADHLVDRAAAVYVDLVRRSPAAQRPGLIPVPSFPAGPFDARIRDAVVDGLRCAPFLAGGDGRPIRPDRACVLPGLGPAAAALLADAIPGLTPWPNPPSVPSAPAGRSWPAGTGSGGGSNIAERLRSVGVRTLTVGEVSAALAGLDRPVPFWVAVYDALTQALAATGADTGDLANLADLPVPRQGGGTIIGARGVLVPADTGPQPDVESGDGARIGVGPMVTDPDDADDADAARTPSLLARAAALVPGLRIAADGVAHPLLDRLGAVPASPAAILHDPRLAAEIRRRREDLEEYDPDPDDVIGFGELVADLVAESGASTDDAGALATTLLTDADGEAWPAGELMLPDARLAGVLADDADLPTVGRRWLDRYPSAVLQAVGVRAGFAVVSIVLPPDPDLPYDGLADWWEEVGDAVGPIDRAEVIADLDLVGEAAWPAALRLIANDRRARDALRPSGSVPSYAGWWISRHASFDGRAAGAWRTAATPDLAGLFDVFPVEVPSGVAADVGVLGGLAQAMRQSPRELVARWADPSRRLAPARVPALTAAVVAVLDADPDRDLPDAVRTLDGSVIGAEAAIVMDRPWFAAVVPAGRTVAGGADPERTAELLDLDTASEAVSVTVRADSEQARLLDEIPAARRCLDFFGLDELAGVEVAVASELSVEAAVHDEPARRQRVAWWVGESHSTGPGAPADRLPPNGSAADRRSAGGGTLLTDGSPAGIGRLIAYLSGRWADRYAFVAIAAGEPPEPDEVGPATGTRSSA